MRIFEKVIDNRYLLIYTSCMNKTPFLLSSELILKKNEDDFLSLKKLFY